IRTNHAWRSCCSTFAACPIAAWLLARERMSRLALRPQRDLPSIQGILVGGAKVTTHAFFRFVTRISAGIFHPPAVRDHDERSNEKNKIQNLFNCLMKSTRSR